MNFFLGAEKMLTLLLLTWEFLALVQHTQILHHWKYIFYNIFFTVKSDKMQPLKSMKDLNWSYGPHSCKNVIWCHKIHCSEILYEISSLIFWKFLTQNKVSLPTVTPGCSRNIPCCCIIQESQLRTHSIGVYALFWPNLFLKGSLCTEQWPHGEVKKRHCSANQSWTTFFKGSPAESSKTLW